MAASSFCCLPSFILLPLATEVVEPYALQDRGFREASSRGWRQVLVMYLECSRRPLKTLDYLIRMNRLHRAVPRPMILLKTLAQLTSARGHSVLFVAKLGEKITGTVGMSLLDTHVGNTAHPYTASTLAAYRGRGIQVELLRATQAAPNGARSRTPVTRWSLRRFHGLY
jgi:hypothetical protein